jgi:hypothetical protein
MFGMLLATTYEAVKNVAPRAKACAHSLTNPVTRDSPVDTDIVAVERAIDLALMADPLPGKADGRAAARVNAVPIVAEALVGASLGKRT